MPPVGFEATISAGERPVAARLLETKLMGLCTNSKLNYLVMRADNRFNYLVTYADNNPNYLVVCADRSLNYLVCVQKVILIF